MTATSDAAMRREQLEQTLVRLVESDSARAWRGVELVDESKAPIVDVMVALATLCAQGRIQRVAPGTYSAANATSAVLRAELETSLFGHTPVNKVS